jgi:hypothetical protein
MSETQVLTQLSGIQVNHSIALLVIWLELEV